jgi:hypothetical protein
MQISKVVVSSARKIPHNELDYANLSAFLSIEAQIGPDEDMAGCVRRLQDMADFHVEQHLTRIAGVSSRSPLAPVVSIAEKTASTAQRLAEKHGAAK